MFLFFFFFFFFFNDTATTEIYTLSLHDVLPISRRSARCESTSALRRPCRTRPPPRAPRTRTRDHGSRLAPSGGRRHAVHRPCGRPRISDAPEPGGRAGDAPGAAGPRGQISRGSGTAARTLEARRRQRGTRVGVPLCAHRGARGTCVLASVHGCRSRRDVGPGPVRRLGGHPSARTTLTSAIGVTHSLVKFGHSRVARTDVGSTPS